MHTKSVIKNGLYLLMSIGLVACSTGTYVNDDGTTEKPVWPKIEPTKVDYHRGTFPTKESLHNVKAGMGKDSLYTLLGSPHFNELWGVREWNFLFHFHTPNQGKNNISTCQYKILYDKNGIARNFYWHPVLPKQGPCPAYGHETKN